MPLSKLGIHELEPVPDHLLTKLQPQVMVTVQQCNHPDNISKGHARIRHLQSLLPNTKIQPKSVIDVAVWIMLAGALGLMLFGFLVSLRFKLNSETHAVLMEEIERFKTQPDPRPTPENRAVVEDLTGWKYERLWARARR